jgi:glycine/serine hydroxymethyltransferase
MLDQLNNKSGFFTDTLAETDAELFASIASELGRQRDEIELIASKILYQQQLWKLKVAL